MIVFALDYKDRVISMLAISTSDLDKAKLTASIYWQGSGLGVHKIRTEHDLDESLRDHPTGVIPIMQTLEKRQESGYGSRAPDPLVVVKPSVCF